MTRRFEGKVAFITGIARGQGRTHAVRLASEGANIIGVDLCQQIDTVASPLSQPEDLAETVRAVEDTGQKILAHQGDIRDLARLKEVVAEGVEAFGRLDIVLANAGIAPVGSPEPDREATFRDVVNVNLVGTWNTIEATAHILIEQNTGGAIVLTSSTQGLTGRGATSAAGVAGYAASKHGVVGLMRSCANWLAPHNIRVNSVHPTGVATPMIMNPVVEAYVEGNPLAADMSRNALPVNVLQPGDITDAVAFLVSDEAKYITGVALPVDAGFTVL
jgi:SDR family mycofactocin-dependent oxidoreductase